MDFDAGGQAVRIPLRGPARLVSPGCTVRWRNLCSTCHTERSTAITEVNSAGVWCATRFSTAPRQLPKFAEDQFRTEDGRWLIPTSEVTLTNLGMDR